jgi:hypothetical protein
VPAQGNETQRLHDLHEHYVWLVNAAIEEGREDLVWRFSDEYLVEAMRLMTEEHENACDRVDCSVCARPRPAPPPPPSFLTRLRRLLW